MSKSSSFATVTTSISLGTQRTRGAVATGVVVGGVIGGVLFLCIVVTIFYLCRRNLRRGSEVGESIPANMDKSVPVPADGPIMNVGGVSEAGPSTSFDRFITAPVLLYHATFEHHVNDIRAGVKLDRVQARTDFCLQKHAFYLTDDKRIAETILVPEISAFQSPPRPTAVMTFYLDLEGLRVKRFSNALAGDALEDWREV